MAINVLDLPLNTEGFYSLEGCQKFGVAMAVNVSTGKRYVHHEGTRCEARETGFPVEGFIHFLQSGR